MRVLIRSHKRLAFLDCPFFYAGVGMKRREWLAGAALTAVSGLWGGAVQASVFPNKTVRIVVPVAAGGSADKLGRTLSQKLTERWGQSVVVENVPGAGGSIGAAQVTKSRPDGYTLLLAGDGLALNALQGRRVPYDVEKDFSGVVKAVVNPQILVVRPDLGVRNLQQYAALLKSKPGQITLGLPGSKGSLQHLAHEMLSQRIGASPNYIAYPGGGPAALDVLGGHIDGTLITLAAVTEYVRAGKLVPIAVTTAQRSKALPNVPTVAESGFPGYAVESWQGIVAPSATPKAVVEQLNRDIVAVLQQPEISAQLEALGFTLAGGSAKQLDDTLRENLTGYAKVIAETGIQLR